MTSPDHPHPPEAQATDEPSSAQPTGFGRVAKRISSRTTDLLAISLVLIVGLGTGWQLVDWWRTDPDDLRAVVPAETVALWGESPVSLEFGDSPFVVNRQTVSGNRQQATETLIETCERSIETPVTPGSMTAAERNLLKQVAGRKPVAEKAGQWRIFHVDGPLILVVGVRGHLADKSVPKSQQTGGDAPGNEKDADHTAANSPRVLCWGLAFPQTEGLWTLYLIQPSAGRQTVTDDTAQMPIPDGSRRILALRDTSGGALIAFSGQGPGEKWMQFYDGVFDKRGWRRTQPWAAIGKSWTARFVPAEKPVNRRVDIQLSKTETAALTGIVSVAARPKRFTTKTPRHEEGEK